MLRHGLLCHLRQAHPNRRDHRRVVIAYAGKPRVVVVADPRDKLQHGGLIPREVGDQLVVGTLQIRVAAEIDDHPVKGHVRVLHAADVVHDDAVAEGVRQPGQLAYSFILRVVGTEIGGLALDGVAHLVQTDHIRQTQIQYKAALLIRRVDHKAHLGKATDRLRDRRARNAQRRGQLINIQPGPGRNLQADDIVVQHLHDQVLQLGVRMLFNLAVQGISVHFFHSLCFIVSRIFPAGKPEFLQFLLFLSLPLGYNQNIRINRGGFHDH